MVRRVRGLALVVALFCLTAQRASAICWFWEDCTYAQTRYPIVLAHGMAGFSTLLGVIDYFFGIPGDLRDYGGNVHVTSVSSFNSPELRGEQLLRQALQIRAITGKAKLNFIGHSHGGFDVRYVCAVRPDICASVTGVGSPTKGVPIADFLRANVLNGSFTETVIGVLGDALGTIIGLLSGRSNPQDTVTAIKSISTSGAAAFNSRYPQGVPSTACGNGSPVVNGVRYYSWSGTGVLTNSLDSTDTAMAIAWLFNTEPNDGFVGRCSSHLGYVLRDNYNMNHPDEVNQVLGLVSILETNPKSVFRAHANRLKNLGL